MKALVLATSMAMVLTTATPAAAASFVFDFTTASFGSAGTNSSESNGNSRTFTQTSDGVDFSIRISAFSVVDGRLTDAYLGRYGNGLGIIAPNSDDRGMNHHAIDNFKSTDILVIQMSRLSTVTSAWTVAYSQDGGAADSDFQAWLGTTANPWNGTASLGGFQLQHGAATAVGTGTELMRRDVFASNQHGNMIAIQAGGIDNLVDGFKLRGLRFDVPVLPVPEPSTWMMMIAGFGLVGAGMRRRRSAGTPAIA